MAQDSGVPHRAYAPSRSSEQVFTWPWCSDGLGTGQTLGVLGDLGTRGPHPWGPPAVLAQADPLPTRGQQRSRSPRPPAPVNQRVY